MWASNLCQIGSQTLCHTPDTFFRRNLRNAALFEEINVYKIYTAEKKRIVTLRFFFFFFTNSPINRLRLQFLFYRLNCGLPPSTLDRPEGKLFEPADIYFLPIQIYVYFTGFFFFFSKGSIQYGCAAVQRFRRGHTYIAIQRCIETLGGECQRANTCFLRDVAPI